MLTIAVDVGGTFTDVFVRDDASKAWVVHEIATAPPTFVEGFLPANEAGLAFAAFFNAYTGRHRDYTEC